MAHIVPHENDILLGRGGNNARHSGNDKLRKFAREHCEVYLALSKKRKSIMTRELLQILRQRSPPVRFLKRDPDTFEWEEADTVASLEKIGQVLRDAGKAGKESSPERRAVKSTSIPHASTCPDSLALPDLTASRDKLLHLSDSGSGNATVRAPCSYSYVDGGYATGSHPPDTCVPPNQDGNSRKRPRFYLTQSSSYSRLADSPHSSYNQQPFFSCPRSPTRRKVSPVQELSCCVVQEHPKTPDPFTTLDAFDLFNSDILDIDQDENGGPVSLDFNVDMF